MDAITNRFAKIWFREQCAVIADPGPYGGTGAETPFMGWVTQTSRTVVGVSGEQRVTDTIVRCPLDTPVAVGDVVSLSGDYAGSWEVEAMTISSNAGLPFPEHKKLILKPKADTSGGGGPYG